jgi:hypothetical protein
MSRLQHMAIGEGQVSTRPSGGPSASFGVRVLATKTSLGRIKVDCGPSWPHGFSFDVILSVFVGTVTLSRSFGALRPPNRNLSCHPSHSLLGPRGPGGGLAIR